MNSFTFYSPTEVIFGKGVEEQAGEKIKAWGGSRVLVHFGGGSVKRNESFQILPFKISI